MVPVVEQKIAGKKEKEIWPKCFECLKAKQNISCCSLCAYFCMLFWMFKRNSNNSFNTDKK